MRRSRAGRPRSPSPTARPRPASTRRSSRCSRATSPATTATRPRRRSRAPASTPRSPHASTSRRARTSPTPSARGRPRPSAAGRSCSWHRPRSRRVVAEELDRLNPAEIVIAGGTGAVSSAVETQLRAYSPQVRRLAGTDRYDTSRKIVADAFDATQVVWVATGVELPRCARGQRGSRRRGLPGADRAGHRVEARRRVACAAHVARSRGGPDRRRHRRRQPGHGIVDLLRRPVGPERAAFGGASPLRHRLRHQQRTSGTPRPRGRCTPGWSTARSSPTRSRAPLSWGTTAGRCTSCRRRARRRPSHEHITALDVYETYLLGLLRAAVVQRQAVQDLLIERSG